MAHVQVAIRAYLYEVAADHIRGRSNIEAPEIAELAETVGVESGYLLQVVRGERSLNLRLLWQLLDALRGHGLSPTVEDAIYWPPLQSARSLPDLDLWRPAPVARNGELRLHLALDEYLAQMHQVASAGREPLDVPSTRVLAEGASVSRRTIQRLRADQITHVTQELLGGVVGTLHRRGINVRPAQLIAEPVELGGE